MQAHVGSSEVQKFFYYIFSTKMQNSNFLDHQKEERFQVSSSEIADEGQACLWWC